MSQTVTQFESPSDLLKVPEEVIDSAPAEGLYQARFEHDACGFGMFVQLDDRPTRKLVDAALDALNRLTHRGAIAPDGLTGDGCGILLRKPRAFLQSIARESGIALGERFASGLVFVHPEQPDAALAALPRTLASEGITQVDYRLVPCDQSAIGAQAKASLPLIYQIFASAAHDMLEERFERALFIARRKAELALQQDPYFYVVSPFDIAARWATNGMVGSTGTLKSNFFQICSVQTWRLARCCFISAFRPTRCRSGDWRIRFGCWRITVKSIRLRVIAAGCARAAQSCKAPRLISASCSRWFQCQARIAKA
ncbi:hypothetical protein HC761_02495 [bacterium]|nr:hypothetical protein [bacterium]